MATITGTNHKASTAPPRKIVLHKFVEARSSELEALLPVVSNRLNNDFRSQRNKRRRTNSYNSQAAKRRNRKAPKLGGGGGGDAESDLNKKEKISRRVRRRFELRKNPESGFTTSGDGTKRLRTHVWHAKRFSMTKLWGFHLPLHVHGRGRGTKALLKRFKQGVIVHDASYHVPVQLEGSEDSLLSVLDMVLSPSPLTQPEDISRQVRSGIIYRSAMLHRAGGPCSHPIAPVTYMWLPVKKETGEDDGSRHDSAGCNEQLKIDGSFLCHQLWVWIHGSAYSDGFDALKFACQRQMQERGAPIDCCSLEGQLTKFEVLGSKAFQLLQNVLQPVTGVSENSWQLKKCSVSDAISQAREFSFPDNEEHITPSAILSYTVKDPRTLSRKTIVDHPESDVTILPEAEADGHAAVNEIPGENEELIISSGWNPEIPGTSDVKTLWDSSSRLNLPVEDSVLCMEKHHQRKEFFCFDNSESQTLNHSMKMQFSRSCPILLLKNCDPKGSCIGWSLILPLSWAKVFWIPLVTNGAHAIGLQEKHEIASKVGLPYFPLDFPDCSACSSYALAKADSLNEEEKRRPASIRPFKIPILPPWDSIPTRFDIASSTEERDTPISNDTDMVDRNLLSETTSGDSAIPTIEHPKNFFKGIIPRKSIDLTNFLHEIRCEHLPLFPTNRRVDFLNCIKESNFGHGQNGITQSHDKRKLCFLRVVLHAFKEGVFDDGAVICAPNRDDISLLTSSVEGGFQLPQSSVQSYWKEQSSGEWEVQVPEDPSLRVSHRWPIGFITTGFVRGSKKPAATAFCEAVLLASLRTEQWNYFPVKQRKEIYVLVRNLRSSAYRLALATIVLEQHEEDIGYM